MSATFCSHFDPNFNLDLKPASSPPANAYTVDIMDVADGSLMRRFRFSSASRPVTAMSRTLFVIGCACADNDSLMSFTVFDAKSRRVANEFSLEIEHGFQRADIVGDRVLLLQVCCKVITH